MGTPSQPPPASLVRPALAAILRRPWLIPEAIRAGLAMGGDRSARSAYLAWRATTAHGDPQAPTTPDELAAFLSWRRRLRRVRS